ncbi:MAG: leucine-rich repeat protein [Paludibacteraceae bacterium]|nr:leucine-rich repeat protein [Paludibacteraceae bacterium]
MKKRLFILFFAILGVSSLCATVVSSNSLIFNLSEADSTASVACPLSGQAAYSGDIVIPDTVFFDNIPYVVCSIDSAAFSDAVNLTSVILPASLQSIRSDAFSGCTGLTFVSFPQCMREIGDFAFYSCSNLLYISLPDSLTTIGRYAFANCKAVSSLSFGNNITTIGDFAFQSCSHLSSVFFPESLLHIGRAVFEHCYALSQISLPQHLLKIDKYAFADCTALSSLVCPASLRTLDDYAFRGCTSLISVSLNEGLAYLGDFAFSGCSRLPSIGIPSSIDTIYASFMYCSSLAIVLLPEGVRHIDKSAFSDCSNLIEINFPASLRSIDSNAFVNCSSLTSALLPDSLSFIGASAFYGCSSLTQLHLPVALRQINDGVFYGCSALSQVVFPDSLVSIGNNAFAGCSHLNAVVLPQSLSSLGVAAFSGCSNLASVSVLGPVSELWNETFADCSRLTLVNLPSSVKSIGRGVFRNCSALRNIDLPTQLERIEGNAFEGCSRLTQIYLPDNVISIGNEAFKNCSLLYRIYLGKKIFYINSDAFADTNLQAAILRGSAFSSDLYNFFSNYSCYIYFTCLSVGSLKNYKNLYPAIANRLYTLDGSDWRSITVESDSAGYVEFLRDYSCDNDTVIYQAVCTAPDSVFTHWEDGSTDNPRIRLVTNFLTDKAYFGPANLAVSFYDIDSVLLWEDSVPYNSMPVYQGPEPVQPQQPGCSFIFRGWQPQLQPATSDFSYFAAYDTVYIQYTVSFYNADGRFIYDVNAFYGDTISFQGPDPQLPATDSCHYLFYGWSPALQPVTGDVVYTAVFDTVVNRYPVSFYDFDGSLIRTDSLPYGQYPEFGSPLPSRPATPEYTYLFQSWVPALAPVTSEASYQASYAASLNSYTVLFLDADGSPLRSVDCFYGELPVFEGLQPAHPASDSCRYIFRGWSPDLQSVTEDAVYTAVFDTIVNRYPVAFYHFDGSLLFCDSLPYGQMPAFADSVPVMSESPEFVYTFRGWMPAPVPVRAAASYVALFDADVRTYPVSFYDFDGSLIAREDYRYGSYPHFDGADPVRDDTPAFSYAFTGWSPAFSVVLDTAAYVAQYDSLINSYTVSAVAEHGTVTGTGTYVYGTEVMLLALPDDGFEFSSWSDGEVANPRTIVVESDVEVEAWFVESSTSLDESESSSSVVKFIHNGSLYLFRNGHLFTVQGQLVK